MSSRSFSSFLSALSEAPFSVIDPSISIEDFTHLDLSKTNSSLAKVDVSSSDALGVYINNHIKKNNATVAFGGYNEERNIYKRSNYFNKADPETERNIHIGMDLWLEVNSPIFTPLDATVHSFKNNTNYGDYGPTIILKHEIDNVTFYTLYGHLSVASLSNLEIGQPFKRGEQIAVLGDALVNGDYPPHLHFQIIKDMQGYLGDYPGVSNRRDLEFFLENCPDPNLLLKLS